MGAWAQRRRRASGGFNAVVGPARLLLDISGASAGELNVDDAFPFAAWRFVAPFSAALSFAQILCSAALPGGWGVSWQLYADAAGLPGTQLFTAGTIDSLDLPTSPALVTISPLSPAVVAATTYWLGVHNNALLGGRVLNVEAVSFTGSKLARSADGSSWSALSTDVGIRSLIWAQP